ncbi:MAG: hypothetical protein GY821_09930 [Gammaproteobacteria bacterium]|nr:hypothetical protein [Gammaproteobacteria bacterium]
MIAVLANLLPYLYTAIAAIILLWRQSKINLSTIGYGMIAFFAAVYSIWAMLGCGKQTLLLGALFLLTSIPLYMWLKRTHKAMP